jgi:hypothetical protein
MKAIRQAVTTESLFGTLTSWMASGSASAGHSLSVLTAFASGGAIEALEPHIDMFLSRDNRLEAIVGLDLGGTDKHALRRLLSLASAYHGQVKVWLWDAPQRASIFHPKLYILRTSRTLSAVIGSANLTLGGLGSNLESQIIFSELAVNTADAKELLSIWDMFARPKPPLKPSFLRELTREVFAEICTRLPDESHEDAALDARGRRDLWKSLSAVRRAPSRKLRRRQAVPTTVRSYLAMDILDETRSTQVQPPADVIEEFFGVPTGADASIEVSIVTSEGMSQPIPRHIVKSRYMRRIEIPPIRELARPCGIVFVRLPSAERRFAYTVIPKTSGNYSAFDSLLSEQGTLARTRRYLIGSPGDSNWSVVSSMIMQPE